MIKEPQDMLTCVWYQDIYYCHKMWIKMEYINKSDRNKHGDVTKQRTQKEERVEQTVKYVHVSTNSKKTKQTYL